MITQAFFWWPESSEELLALVAGWIERSARPPLAPTGRCERVRIDAERANGRTVVESDACDLDRFWQKTRKAIGDDVLRYVFVQSKPEDRWTSMASLARPVQ
ncbi:MAG: hypothetical protein ACE367_16985 [Acidimicrobiales bacterium]